MGPALWIRRRLMNFVPSLRDYEVVESGGKVHLRMVAELESGDLVNLHLHPYSTEGWIDSELAQASGKAYARACRLDQGARSEDIEVVTRRYRFRKYYGVFAPAKPEFCVARAGHPRDYAGRNVLETRVDG